MSQVHATAILGKNVELGEGVTIAPYVVIEDNVTIGARTSVGASAFIGSNTTIGEECRIFNGASIGTIAQDLKFRDEECSLVIGNRTQFREFCTINKGTAENNGLTQIGDDCAFLAYGHVAHDCMVGNNVVASNNLALAGHVTVEDHVIFGGFASVHQFTRIGAHAFIGANTFAKMDIVPFSLVGHENGDGFIAGLNKIGLERRGFAKEDISAIKKAYKYLFRSNLNLDEAAALISTELGTAGRVGELLEFIGKSQRGLSRMRS